MNGEFERIRKRLALGYISDEGCGPLYDAVLAMLEELDRRDREEREAAERSVGG